MFTCITWSWLLIIIKSGNRILMINLMIYRHNVIDSCQQVDIWCQFVTKRILFLTHFLIKQIKRARNHFYMYKCRPWIFILIFIILTMLSILVIYYSYVAHLYFVYLQKSSNIPMLIIYFIDWNFDIVK